VKTTKTRSFPASAIAAAIAVSAVTGGSRLQPRSSRPRSATASWRPARTTARRWTRRTRGRQSGTARGTPGRTAGLQPRA